MTLTPYEEISELIKKMKEAKETLTGTDAEYFEKEQMDWLIDLSNDISNLALGIKAWYSEE